MNIIFDFDGTLFDTRTVDVKAFNRALADMGYPERSEANILAAISRPLKDIAAGFVGEDPHKISRFVKMASRYEQEEIPLHAQMYEGVPMILRQLKEEGHHLAICSNGSHAYLKAILDKFDLFDLFTIVWHAHEGYTKDQALDIIMKRLPAGKTVYAGDRLEDREAAHSNGIEFIGTAYGFGGAEMDGVHFLAHEPEQLLSLIQQLCDSDNGAK